MVRAVDAENPTTAIIRYEQLVRGENIKTEFSYGYVSTLYFAYTMS